MSWPPFKLASGSDRADLEDESIEVVSALMMGARFERHGRGGGGGEGRWVCVDDTPESYCSQKTGSWNFKRNAARAYLGTKGLYVSKDGKTIHPGSPRTYGVT